jgi:hypothetical protein
VNKTIYSDYDDTDYTWDPSGSPGSTPAKMSVSGGTGPSRGLLRGAVLELTAATSLTPGDTIGVLFYEGDPSGSFRRLGAVSTTVLASAGQLAAIGVNPVSSTFGLIGTPFFRDELWATAFSPSATATNIELRVRPVVETIAG